MAAADVPPYHELLWPTLQAVTELGGSGSIGEIADTVIKRQGFSDAEQAVPQQRAGNRDRLPASVGFAPISRE